MLDRAVESEAGNAPVLPCRQRTHVWFLRRSRRVKSSSFIRQSVLLLPLLRCLTGLLNLLAANLKTKLYSPSIPADLLSLFQDRVVTRVG